jgi:hypothetical protein
VKSVNAGTTSTKPCTAGFVPGKSGPALAPDASNINPTFGLLFEPFPKLRFWQGNSTYFFHLKDPLKSAIFLKKIPPQSRIEPEVRRTSGSQSKKEEEERMLS